MIYSVYSRIDRGGVAIRDTKVESAREYEERVLDSIDITVSTVANLTP